VGARRAKLGWFLGRSSKPLTTRGLESDVSSPSGVWGKAPATKNFGFSGRALLQSCYAKLCNLAHYCRSEKILSPLWFRHCRACTLFALAVLMPFHQNACSKQRVAQSQLFKDHLDTQHSRTLYKRCVGYVWMQFELRALCVTAQTGWRRMVSVVSYQTNSRCRMFMARYHDDDDVHVLNNAESLAQKSEAWNYK